MRIATLTISLLAAFALSVGQVRDEKTAAQLRDFEVDWLTASLNDDISWLSSFHAGKFDFTPAAGSPVDERHRGVSELVDTALRPNEMKIRIAGTISLLTNDPARNRSFYFLDTFNKTAGKWRVIASSLSPAPAGDNTVDRVQVENELLKLENLSAQARVTNDQKVIGRIFSPEFVGTSNTGLVGNREEWVVGTKTTGIKSLTKSDMHIRVISDTVAVVTGVDTTVRLDKDGREIVHADRFTDTWTKRDGSWQCVASHLTRIR